MPDSYTNMFALYLFRVIAFGIFWHLHESGMIFLFAFISTVKAQTQLCNLQMKLLNLAYDWLIKQKKDNGSCVTITVLAYYILKVWKMHQL